MSKSGRFVRNAFIIAAISSILTPSISRAEVLIPREAEFAENSILFYDPCNGDNGSSPGPVITPSESEHWDGSCNNISSSNATWLSSQIKAVQLVARRNSLPWELILAQTFAESGGGKKEVCPYNPLGLKVSGPSCNGRHRSFNSYEEAYQHYVDSIRSIREIKGKFPNNPYAAIEYIQYGSGAPYAQCSSPEYIEKNMYGCGGHQLGDPTPIYVPAVSSWICGIQKWAQANGYSVSGGGPDSVDQEELSNLYETPEVNLESTVKVYDRCIRSSNDSSDNPNDDGSAIYDDSLILYTQGEEPWGSMPYGNCGGTTIRAAGCGPTSLAMIISNKLHQRITPDVIAKQAVASGYRACGSGSYHSITNLATRYGLSVSATSGWNRSTIDSILKNGGMVHVSSSGTAPFTSGGHFIAIRGITSSGKWLIFDSANRNNSLKEWDPNTILSASNRNIGTYYVVY